MPGIELPPQDFSNASHSILVVLLHAYRHTPGRLDSVKNTICKKCTSTPHVIVPQLPLTMWSFADLNDIAEGVVQLIDQQVEHRTREGHGEFKQILTRF